MTLHGLGALMLELSRLLASLQCDPATVCLQSPADPVPLAILLRVIRDLLRYNYEVLLIGIHENKNNQ